MTAADASSAARLTEPAPAKINLCLHVTGRRPDGYHLLDSLVVFAGPEASDRVTVAPALSLSLKVTGPRAAGVPRGPENLVLRAAAALAPKAGARIVLDKRLPTASGIGGGTADGAAALRALARLWDRALPDLSTALALGADMPVCLAGTTSRMSGIGERLAPVSGWPVLAAVLVNPGIGIATPDVFRALERVDGAPLAEVPHRPSVAQALDWLTSQRNDLEPPAVARAPAIAHVLERLAAAPGCRLARMSGSGATCFGLFPRPSDAEAAAQAIARSHPNWWSVATRLGAEAQP